MAAPTVATPAVLGFDVGDAETTFISNVLEFVSLFERIDFRVAVRVTLIEDVSVVCGICPDSINVFESNDSHDVSGDIDTATLTAEESTTAELILYENGAPIVAFIGAMSSATKRLLETAT